MDEKPFGLEIRNEQKKNRLKLFFILEKLGVVSGLVVVKKGPGSSLSSHSMASLAIV